MTTRKFKLTTDSIFSLVLISGLSLIVFGDLVMKSFVSLWVAYVTFIGLSFFTRRAYFPFLLAGLATLSSIIDIIRGGALWEGDYTTVNSMLGVLTFWFIAVIIHVAIKNTLTLNQERLTTLQLNQELELKAWLQRAVAGVNESVLGFATTKDLNKSVLRQLVSFSEIDMGLVLTMGPDRNLSIEASLGYSKTFLANFEADTGLLDRVIQTGKPVYLDKLDLSDDHLGDFGPVKPSWLAVIPILFEDKLQAVIQLAGVNLISDQMKTMLEVVAENIGRALETARNRKRLEELYAETQHRNEELSQQQEEMKTLNDELEDQSISLLKAQDQLESQQIELEEINESLEQKKRELELQKAALESTNRSLRKSKRETENASRYKSEFLSNMSHELRTPLNSILVLTQILRDKADANGSDEDLESLQTILNSGDDLLILINDILDLSKIEAGKVDLTIEAADIHDIAENLEATFDHLAKNKGLELSITTEDDLPDIVTDQYRVEQILKNFLSNALKFTESGEVSVRFKQDKNNAELPLQFEVKDTGIGIAESQQEQIFQAFKQVDGSTVRKYGGTGLGLSISLELAQLLGGKITLESVEGEGTTFCLHLPLVLEQPSDIKPKKTKIKPKPKAASLNTPSAYRSFDDSENLEVGARLALVIEDQEAQAKNLVSLLRKNGYQCIARPDGETGLVAAKSLRPHLIVLDLKLPLTSGEKVLEELRESSLTAEIPILVFSAYNKPTSLQKYRLVEYLDKPAEENEFCRSLSRLETRAIARHIILTVGYQESDQQMIVESLGRVNYHSIIHLSTKKEALNYIASNEVPSCIVTEFQLSDGTANTLITDVRTVISQKSVSFVVFATDGMSEEEEEQLIQMTDSVTLRNEKSNFRLSDDVNIALKNQASIRINRSSYQKSDRFLLKDKTILLADDDMRNVFALKKVIESYQARVTVAKNGQEAVDRVLNAEEAPVDLVLMDIMMPVMDGLSAIRLIRENEQKVPIIALTAKAMPADRVDALSAGADEYCSKPVDVRKLVGMIEQELKDSLDMGGA